MPNDLDRPLERASRIRMTADEKEQQRRSFAYGNTNIENPRITRGSVDRQAEALEAEASSRG